MFLFLLCSTQKIIHDAIKKESEQEFPLFSDEDIEGVLFWLFCWNVIVRALAKGWDGCLTIQQGCKNANFFNDTLVFQQ